MDRMGKNDRKKSREIIEQEKKRKTFDQARKAEFERRWADLVAQEQSAEIARENRRKIVKLLIPGFLLFIILYLSIVGRSNEEAAIRENHIDVVGTVSHIGHKNIDISYSVGNESFTSVESKPYSDIAVGEEFFAMVKKTNHNSILVLYNRPILDSIKYKFASVNPIDISSSWITFKGRALYFSYKVGDEEYDRIQLYEEGRKPDDFSKLIVRYRVDRPGIGYLISSDG